MITSRFEAGIPVQNQPIDLSVYAQGLARLSGLKKPSIQSSQPIDPQELLLWDPRLGEKRSLTQNEIERLLAMDPRTFAVIDLRMKGLDYWQIKKTLDINLGEMLSLLKKAHTDLDDLLAGRWVVNFFRQHPHLMLATTESLLLPPNNQPPLTNGHIHRKGHTTVDEDKIVSLLKDSDPAGIAAIQERYGRLIFTIAFQIIGSRETTEEVVQDVLQHIWRSASSFQPDIGRFSSWLISIAKHRAIDATRSRNERTRIRESHLYPSDDPTVTSLEDDVLLRDHYARVHQALESLPPNQRQVIELAYYRELTHREIADILGLPLGTIKSRLRGGMAKLKDLLQPIAE